MIKRTIFQDHVNILNKRQDDLLAELKRRTDEGFPKAKEEWEKTVVQWRTYFPVTDARTNNLRILQRQDKTKPKKQRLKRARAKIVRAVLRVVSRPLLPNRLHVNRQKTLGVVRR